MRKVFTFIVLMVIWCIFSGQFDAFHLALGVFSCAVVAHLTSRYIFAESTSSIINVLKISLRMIPYSLWLIKEIYNANVHVFTLAMIPGQFKHVNPMLIRFKTRLKSPMARYLLANSITLTPGTVTLRLTETELHVHSISAKTTIGLEGDMEARVARVFGEEVTDSPEISTFS